MIADRDGELAHIHACNAFHPAALCDIVREIFRHATLLSQSSQPQVLAI